MYRMTDNVYICSNVKNDITSSQFIRQKVLRL